MAFALFIALTVAAAHFHHWTAFATGLCLTVIAAIFGVIASQQARIDRCSTPDAHSRE
ncbi:hypothetical protein [Nonomuraea sp. JJY05]|uniref:hypothetical protein n=1 Tax=Nonomuraea sp. JJY05 TaxID=3350255 RepID=UPI00373E376E